MAEEPLTVVLYGDLIGHGTRTVRDGAPTFSYTDEYAETGEVPLSTQLPLRLGRHDPRRTAVFLAGLLPENRATRRRWAGRLAVDEDDPLGLLAQMGWDCPGAVQFCRSDQLEEMRARPAETAPLGDDQIAARLRELRQDSASWSMPDEQWSLPGQQDKFALAWDGGSWHRALGSAATTHILKPGIGRLHNQALVEHATMVAAASLGVNVAHTEFRHFSDEPAVVVQRFDRLRTGGGDIVRLHQEDFCQATGREPERKYEARGGPGATDLATVVKRNSTDVESDLRAVADFMIINYVAGAPDGHSKNISISLIPGRTAVAPLYDLATGLPYQGRDVERTVALSIGGERQFSRIYGTQWDKAARSLSVGPPFMRQRVSHLATHFPDAFATALASIDDPEARQVRERTMDRLGEHCANALVRLLAPGQGA